MLLQRLQHWALERGSLIILFERHHTPFLNHCQQAWQLQNGALQPLC
ncbi:ABC transporter ATP-binding protein [Escherichia coli]|nr:ABC transporter ATP-binding protein [Escherichia coli]